MSPKPDLMLEATHLRGRRWAVKPTGQLGTCGFYPVPWQVIYVTASTAREAIERARLTHNQRSASTMTRNDAIAATYRQEFTHNYPAQRGRLDCLTSGE